VIVAGRTVVTQGKPTGERPGVVLRGVSIRAEPGECVAIVGRNGAGKSALLSAIAGTVRVTSGSVAVGGTERAGLKPHQRVRLGVGSTMEWHRVFAPLTVEDNLIIAGRAVLNLGSVALESPPPWICMTSTARLARHLRP
jgi:ABC-type branched-subunit amino acid transport system ATPase component